MQDHQAQPELSYKNNIPSQWSENQEFMKILAEEIDKLPSNQKIAFTLKEIDGESTEDICKILDISVTNLGVLIYRAKNKDSSQSIQLFLRVGCAIPIPAPFSQLTVLFFLRNRFALRN